MGMTLNSGMTLALNNTGGAVSIIALLAAGAAVLVVYDPSDLSTMFQDSAGATPVTAPGQSVGLVLDKGQGLALGVETLTNGDFASGTTGWLGATSDIASGVLTWTAVVNNSGLFRSNSVWTGGVYEITVVVTSISQGAVTATVGIGVPSSVNCFNITTPGTHTFRQGNVSGDNFLRVYSVGAATTAVIDSISIKRVAGYHASQPTAASQPVYGVVPEGGRRNLLTYTEQFDNAAWTEENTVAANNQETDDLGALTLSSITVSAISNFHGVYSTAPITVVSGSTYSARAVLKQGTHRYATVRAYRSNNNWSTVVVDMQTGAITQTSNGSGSGSISASAATVVNGCVVVTFSSSQTGTSLFFSVDAANSATPTLVASTGNVSFLGTGTVFYAGKVQYEPGSTATNYQRVVSAFDVTEAGVKTLHYLQFDGAYYFLVTGTITPGVDKVQVFAGVRKLSDAAVGVITEFSPTIDANNGSFGCYAPGSVAANYGWYSKGTTIRGSNVATYTAPISNVLAGIGDISGDISRIRVDGNQVTEDLGNQGSGNFLAYPMYIGRRAGTSLPFNGLLFGLITRFSAANLDAPRIDAAEAYMGGKTGVAV